MILSQIQKTESTHYTYTFNIKKEGAPKDALLENLSPLADGNQKKLDRNHYKRYRKRSV